jgi:ribosomal protein L13E
LSAPKKKAKVKPKGKKAPPRKKAATKAKPKAVKAVAKQEKPKGAVPKPKKVVEKREVEKKVVEKKEVASKPIVKAEPVALGPPPKATVATMHVDSLHERSARGFSFGELASAGIPLNAAKREGLSLDIRRRSVVEGNVDALKGWFKSPAAKPASKTGEPVAVPAVSKKK